MNAINRLLIVVAVACVGDVLTAQPSARKLVLVEEVRIDGAQEDLSGLTENFTFAPRGLIAVFDNPNFRFVFFDRTGKRVGTFGRRGDGPGEFAPRPAGDALSRVSAEIRNLILFDTGLIGDTLWVYNSEQRRFTLISPELKLVRTIPLPPLDAAKVVAFRVIGLLPGDRVLGRAVFGSRVNGANVRTDSAFAIMERNGTVQRRVAPLPPDRSTVRVTSPRPTSVTIPFGHRASVDFSPAGDRLALASTSITSASGGLLHLTALRPSGDTIFSRSHPYTSTAVTTRMADSALERTSRSYANSAEAIKTIRASMPAVTRPFDDITLGPDGSMWATRENHDPRAGELVLFSATGELVGTATLPRARLQLYNGTRTEVWATERDADGFFSIVRFRVEPPR